jgi:hypothetical protein
MRCQIQTTNPVSGTLVFQSPPPRARSPKGRLWHVISIFHESGAAKRSWWPPPGDSVICRCRLTVVGALSDVPVPQCRNDLRAAGKSLCLPIGFGRPKVEIRRITAEA